MDKQVKQYVDQFMAELVRKNPGELEFHQAVQEVRNVLVQKRSIWHAWKPVTR